MNVYRDDAAVPLARPEPAQPLLSLDFRSVYADHFEFAYRSLRLLGVAPDALEDAAQDVFGVVSRRLREFAGQSSLRTWIFAIVHRVAANYLRTRRRKQPPREPLTESIPANQPSPEACAQAAQAVARVQEFCDRLDDGRRVVFVLGLVEAVPASEIAPLLGIPLFTVYSRMRTLREQLQRFLEDNEVEK